MSEHIKETRSTCPYCGTGCGVIIESLGETIINVRGDPEHPANFGKLCTKGSTLHLSAVKTGRALYPELRTSKADSRQRVSWDQALEVAAERFASVIREHGPDAVAFYVSGQLLTEDYYVFNKLAKGLIGTNNIDSNSRLCMSSAVAGYKATLGADSVPCSYEDLALADLFFLAGSNAAWAHPILFRRLEEAREKNGARMIVVDPRRTDTASSADLHLQIQPGTDVILYSAMLHVMLWEGLLDQDFIAQHTEGFEELRNTIRDLSPVTAARICGVPEQDIIQAARWFAQAKAPLSLWCQGLNQSSHGTANNAALIHLHLATGTIGKPGMGPFSLTGQPNAMGGREVGAMANLLSAHRDLGNGEHRAEIAKLWGVDQVPATPGLTAVELFQAMEEGKIKALWIACTNPAHSLPDQNKIRQALSRCDFVVLQEAFADTETCAYADLLLPASTWGEKEGTVTNSERRITRVRPAVAALGEARADWRIARDFALALGVALDRQALAAKLFNYPDPASIFAEHALSTKGRDLDLSGMDYPLLDEEGPQTWPRPESGTPGPARLYGDGRFATPSGKARFYPLESTLAKGRVAESTNARHPLALNTGRLRDQWHGMSRTGRVASLHAHEAQPRLHLNLADMALRNLQEGDWVKVSNSRGEGLWQVTGRPDIAPAQAWLPMHWGEINTGTAGANLFTIGSTDPVSRQPELKHAAIRLEKVSLTQRLVALRTVPVGEEGREQVLQWRQRLRDILPADGSATLTLAGRERPVLHLQWSWAEEEGANTQAEKLERVARALDIPEDQALVYLDERRGIIKRAMIEQDSLTGLVFAGETVATGWLLEALVEQRAMADLKPWLFAPRALPPAGGTSRGRIVCNCMNVGENQIKEAIAAGAGLDVLKAELRCGTGCGACVPELKRLVEEGGEGAQRAA